MFSYFLRIKRRIVLTIIAVLLLAGGFAISPKSALAANLILNSSLESQAGDLPQNWQKGNWGANAVSFNYPVEGSGGAGAKAAQVQISNYTDGDAKWVFDGVAVTPGFYVFSDKYVSTVESRVVAEFHLIGGGNRYLEIGAPGISNSWQAFEAGFNVPAGASSVTVFHLINTMGSLTTDDYSLTKATNPNAFDKGLVSLTFDDGWQSIYNNGIPILNAAGFKSTQYIITNEIGDVAGGYMTEDEITAMYNQGHDIEAHTRNHSDLTALSPSELQAQVAGSRADLLNLSFKPVNNFAYPYGAYNDTVKRSLFDAGFIGARTTEEGFNDKSTDKYGLKVQYVQRGGFCDGIAVSATALNQLKNYILTAAQTNTWLILMFHQIDNISANCYGNTPKMLQDIVDYLKISDVDVVTVAEGLNKMNNTPPSADTTAPIITLHENVSVSTASIHGTKVNYILPAVTDNVNINLVASCLPESGSLFPIGKTRVVCNAVDSSGNKARRTSFMIIVGFDNVKKNQKIIFNKPTKAKEYGGFDFFVHQLDDGVYYRPLTK